MKRNVWMPLCLTALVAFGCVYDVPVTTEHCLPIDPLVLGRWRPVDEKEQGDMLILKFSDTEYLVEYPMDKEAMLFRAYLFKLNDATWVQLEILGNSNGEIADKQRYQIMSYRLADGVLELRTLNSDIIGKDAPTSDELRKRMIEKRDHPQLLQEPGRFRRTNAKR